MASVRRIDVVGSNVETQPKPNRRTDTIGAAVETQLDKIRKITTVGVMVEYYAPMRQGPKVQVI